MILGLNTNHEYSGKVFHVQTEDSGLDNPVIITHCFIGGTIIESRRIDYADALGRDDLEEHLNTIARAQHKAVIEGLLAGEFAKAARQAVMGGGASSRPDIPIAGKGPRRGQFKPGGAASRPSMPAVRTVTPPTAPGPLAPKRPPPLPARAPVSGRSTQSFGDTQVMDIDDADLIAEESAELTAEDAVLAVDGPLQFPSALLRADPLDAVTLAYLLEDDPSR